MYYTTYRLSMITYLWLVIDDLSLLIDRDLDLAEVLVGCCTGLPVAMAFSEFVLEELLDKGFAACNCFCWLASKLLKRVEACSLKCSSNPQKALHHQRQHKHVAEKRYNDKTCAMLLSQIL